MKNWKPFFILWGLLLTLWAFGQAFTLHDLAFVGNVSPAAATSSPTPELVWWKFTEGSGTTIAGSAATSDDGTTDADWVTGKSGSGYALDFVPANGDSAITDSNVTYGVNVITVCGWVWSDDNTGTKIMWGSDWVNDNIDSWNVRIEPGPDIILQMSGTTGDRTESFTAPATGAWYHLLVVFDASTANGDIKVYVDGASQSTSLLTDTKTGTSNFATLKFGIGFRIGYDDLYWDGRFDDVRLYSSDQSANATAIKNDAQ